MDGDAGACAPAPPGVRAGAGVGAVTNPRYPAWTHELGERRLVEMFGELTLARGQEYAREGRVTQIAVGSGTGGSLIQAQVRGSGYRSYQTLARQYASTDTVVTTCSCPVRAACKHGAALLWHLRTANLRALTPAWQRALNEIVGQVAAPSVAQPLAIQVQRSSNGRLQLRPMMQGRDGRWVRRGISWDSVDNSWNAQYPAEQRRVLSGLAHTREQRHGSTSYTRRFDVLELDDLGAAMWHWLREAEAAGVPLIAGAGTPTVRLAEGLARVSSRLEGSGVGPRTAHLCQYGRAGMAGAAEQPDRFATARFHGARTGGDPAGAVRGPADRGPAGAAAALCPAADSERGCARFHCRVLSVAAAPDRRRTRPRSGTATAGPAQAGTRRPVRGRSRHPVVVVLPLPDRVRPRGRGALPVREGARLPRPSG